MPRRPGGAGARLSVAAETDVSMARRLARLARTGSPRVVARAARRELTWRRHEAAVAAAARAGRTLLVGPFLGEVGYELLYWLPVVRRLLAEHAVPGERVVVLTRGGAAVWYGDIAERSVELLDLLSPEDYLRELLARRRRGGDAKQFLPDSFDERLARLAVDRVGDAAVVHPLLMFSRMRFVLEGLQPPEEVLRLGVYRGLDPTGLPGLPRQCPADYVALKLYFSDSFPDSEETRELVARLVDALTARVDVVVLTSGVQLDEHREWVFAGSRAHDASSWVTPQDNLAVQTAVVARARGLVATYGGFSYLGPLLGVPTLALQTQEPFNAVHLGVLRAAFPEADYDVAGADAEAAAAAFWTRLARGPA